MTDTSDTGDDGYPVLADEAELLLRQVHPAQLQVNGEPDSSAFMAKSPHNFLLSTRREFIGAERAYREWVANHESVGTFGVSVGEINRVSLSAFDDSSAPGMPAGHASIDFRGISDSACRKRARKLRDQAVTRGRLFPESTDATS